MIELSENNERKFANKYIGKEIEVLFENGHDGHTTNYIEVYSENEQELNKIIKVIPTKFENGKLFI